MGRLAFYKFFKDFTNFFLSVILSIAVIVWVIQAVNYLDLVSEDGHGFKIYFMFTLFTLPKIIARILPFIFFISIFYSIIRIEEKNELQIFWLNGIQKIDFIKFIAKFSFLYLFCLSLLNLFIVPYFQDSARSFIRTSDLDYFASLINEKRFNDTVSDLTIYVDNIDDNGKFNNIFLKDKISETNSQMIFAKNGEIKKINNTNILSLNNGRILNQTIQQYNVSSIFFKSESEGHGKKKYKKILDELKNNSFEDVQRNLNENNKFRNKNIWLTEIKSLGFVNYNEGEISNVVKDRKFNRVSIINEIKKHKLNVVNFNSTEFNLSKYKTTTITTPKIQEYSTRALIKCYLNLKENFDAEFLIFNKYICKNAVFKDLKQEILKRLITPFYIPILALISCLLLLKSKDQPGFNKQKVFVFLFSLLIIIFSEIITKYSGINVVYGTIFSIIPFIFSLSIFIYLNLKLKKNVY
tara:strand:+ start:570 stop:1970 length:1401 start_codon:yes stop_codon:yes gene_type:complete